MDTPAPNTAEPMAPDVALSTLQARKADPAFVAKWGAGDPAARSELAALHVAAYPDEAADATPAAPIDEGFGPVPESPERYQLEYRHGQEVDKDLDAEFRAMAHGAALPEPIARLMFKEWNAVAADPPTPDQIELQARATAANLTLRYGEEGYKARLAAAQSVINALPDAQRARAKDLLNRSGIGNHPLIIEHLATLATNRAARKAG